MSKFDELLIDIINNFFNLIWEKSTNIYIYILLTISSKSRFETRISIYNILKQETTAISFILKVYSIKKRKRRISNKNILFTYIAFDYTLTKKKKKLLQPLLHEHKKGLIVVLNGIACCFNSLIYLYVDICARDLMVKTMVLFSTRFVHCKLFRPLFNRGLSTQLKFTLNTRLFHSARESCPAQSRSVYPFVSFTWTFQWRRISSLTRP